MLKGIVEKEGPNLPFTTTIYKNKLCTTSRFRYKTTMSTGLMSERRGTTEVTPMVASCFCSEHISGAILQGG